MMQSCRYILFTSYFLGYAAIASAELKIGYIQSERIRTEYEEFTEAESQLQMDYHLQVGIIISGLVYPPQDSLQLIPGVMEHHLIMEYHHLIPHHGHLYQPVVMEIIVYFIIIHLL